MANASTIGLAPSQGRGTGSAARKPTEVPDLAYYRPTFSPWLGLGEFKDVYLPIRPYTLVSPERCYNIYTLLRQALSLPGEVWECGVFKGGTSMLMADTIQRWVQQTPGATPPQMRLFDSFEGMPETTDNDWHQAGDFVDTSVETVRGRVPQPFVSLHAGFIPETFKGLEQSVLSFAHVDVDIYEAVQDCSAFIYDRMLPGGFIVYDDYGFVSCPGARKAVDQFYQDKPEKPLVMPNGHAVVFKQGVQR